MKVMDMGAWQCRTSTLNTRHYRQFYEQSMSLWLAEWSSDYFVTFNFNEPTTLNGARRKLRSFFARTDRWLIGPHWLKQTERRSDMLIFPENIESNLHYHAMGRLPEKALQLRPLVLQFHLEEIWLRLMPAGSLNVQAVYDQKGAAEYVTKQLPRQNRIESFILTREFWPT